MKFPVPSCRRLVPLPLISLQTCIMIHGPPSPLPSTHPHPRCVSLFSHTGRRVWLVEITEHSRNHSQQQGLKRPGWEGWWSHDAAETSQTILKDRARRCTLHFLPILSCLVKDGFDLTSRCLWNRVPSQREDKDQLGYWHCSSPVNCIVLIMNVGHGVACFIHYATYSLIQWMPSRLRSPRRVQSKLTYTYNTGI